MTLIVGIDPGNKGGISVFALPLNDWLWVRPIPTKIVTQGNKKKRVVLDGVVFKDWLVELSNMDMDTYVFMEDIYAFRSQHQAAFSMLNFGKGWGRIHGLVEGVLCEPTVVKPGVWKRFIFGRVGSGGDKAVSIRRVKEIYPNINLRPTKRCRVDSDGMAEAMLIAVYGMNQINWGEKYDGYQNMDYRETDALVGDYLRQ